MTAHAMNAFLQQLRVSMRLHFRNRMALLYSYLFPTLFLAAFWMLYRFEQVPIARHLGELLTVTALGGACFGLPTTMVSERERGVWRRYRLAPVATGTLLASTVLARYVLLLVAGLLQVTLAMAIGMPVPNHPLDLWLAFTFVSFALLGLGLVIATLANNVPAVQALGQCIFLPMLIIGGVAVQIASLPSWAQRVSSFFPGRYAVEALQATVTGDGLGDVGFSLLALTLIGAAASLAGIKMFRWDSEQRYATRGGKGWLAVALGAWAAVGILAESRAALRVKETTEAQAARMTPAIPIQPPSAPSEPPSSTPAAGAGGATAPPATHPPSAPAGTSASPTVNAPPSTSTGGSVEKPRATSVEKPAGATTAPAPAPSPAPAPAPPPPQGSGPPEPATWRDVTPAHLDEILFNRLPSDAGVVSPIAPADEALEPDLEAELEEVRSRLATWPPGQIADPVQRVRNVLYVAAVPDVFQMPLERYLPHVVFERLQADVPKDDLIKILFWVATHPMGGDDSAVDQLRTAGLSISGPSDMDQARERVMLYALKLLGRLIGKIPS